MPSPTWCQGAASLHIALSLGREEFEGSGHNAIIPCRTWVAKRPTHTSKTESESAVHCAVVAVGEIRVAPCRNRNNVHVSANAGLVSWHSRYENRRSGE